MQAFLSSETKLRRANSSSTLSTAKTVSVENDLMDQIKQLSLLRAADQDEMSDMRSDLNDLKSRLSDITIENGRLKAEMINTRASLQLLREQSEDKDLLVSELKAENVELHQSLTTRRRASSSGKTFESAFSGAPLFAVIDESAPPSYARPASPSASETDKSSQAEKWISLLKKSEAHSQSLQDNLEDLRLDQSGLEQHVSSLNSRIKELTIEDRYQDLFNARGEELDSVVADELFRLRQELVQKKAMEERLIQLTSENHKFSVQIEKLKVQPVTPRDVIQGDVEEDLLRKEEELALERSRTIQLSEDKKRLQTKMEGLHAAEEENVQLNFRLQLLQEQMNRSQSDMELLEEQNRSLRLRRGSSEASLTSNLQKEQEMEDLRASFNQSQDTLQEMTSVVQLATEQIESLKDQLAQREDEIQERSIDKNQHSRLQSRVADLESTVRSLTTERNELLDQLDELRDSCSTNISDMERKRSTEANRAAEYGRQNVELSNQNEKLREEMEVLKREKAMADTQNQSNKQFEEEKIEWTIKLEELESQKREAHRLREEMIVELQRTERELVEERDKKSILREEETDKRVEESEQKWKLSEEKCRSTVEELERERSELSQLRISISDRDERIRRLEETEKQKSVYNSASIAELQEEIIRNKHTISTLEDQLGKAEESNRDKDSQLSSLQVVRDDLEQKIATISHDHDSLEQSHRWQLAQTREDHDEEMNKLACTHASDKEDLASRHQTVIQQMKTDATKELKSLREAHIEEYSRLTKEKSELNTEKSKLELARQQALDEVERLEEELERETKTRGQREKELQMAHVKIQEMDTNVVRLSQKLNDTTMSRDELQKQMERLKNEFDEEKSTRERSQQERDTIKQKYRELAQVSEQLSAKLNRESTLHQKWKLRAIELKEATKQHAVTLKVLSKELAGVKTQISQFTLNATAAATQVLHQVVEKHKELTVEAARAIERYGAEVAKRRALFNQLEELKGNIRVYCRVRPLSSDEIENAHKSAIDFPQADTLTVTQFVGGKEDKKSFEFERVFGPNSLQSDVFSDVKPLMTSVIDGYNVCIFAYGQTGSGKTYTMTGPSTDRGINIRALQELFIVARERNTSGEEPVRFRVSMMEIYNDTVRDLLHTGATTASGLDVRLSEEGDVSVEGLIEESVNEMEDVLAVMDKGTQNRTVGSTFMNSDSSRSHAMLRVSVYCKNKIQSVLSLVDLAGSERLSRSGAMKEQMVETQHINQSLSALGDVISALRSKKGHVPYRNSKLTFLLQNCLKGDSKVLMFVQVSPSRADATESVCSLNFASRVNAVVPSGSKEKVMKPTSSSTPPIEKKPTVRLPSACLSTSSSWTAPPQPSSSRETARPSGVFAYEISPHSLLSVHVTSQSINRNLIGWLVAGREDSEMSTEESQAKSQARALEERKENTKLKRKLRNNHASQQLSITRTINRRSSSIV
ncbi:hypothetical protein PROFUN_06966 [Planoprotostelium fungivorum]|uniref:Kinesin motor domain-containing protein n=1 Tax=Planoprotostelium fungivorum TaxID=1890364 RepID=A0A2P6NN71_9EUKA|nr:hypothetical protein PROFUN_06966 [Planoprotostelium fungivorum]